jgi:hypothetical protein
LNPNTRGCVAAIAAGLCGFSKVAALYDQSASKNLNIGGSVSADKIDVYDFDRSCHVSGTLDNLFDYGNKAHINLEINGDSFSGYDYASKFHFRGTVQGGMIQLYDYETEKYYTYS